MMVFICLQDGGLHLDIVYITESIIAVGFPGADTSSNILGFTEVGVLEALLKCYHGYG